ncbi:hypothetical protein EST38_g3972 [Candolleomyces aberdarensis]|uniref:Uncharacterized protein n=1 Tax=Candolleomyces aberdarensis TaxID=2316362 RepID=A0A4V1Q4F2_9AGAR|nr:hypothetical protein EST38_g3972 [Candolleomyces aberdarensis]
MAFSDLLVFVIFVGVVGAVIYGVMLASKSIDAGVASTKESLKARGLDVSATGVSMRSDKRFDRQDYLDATQRYVPSFDSLPVAYPPAPSTFIRAHSASQ